jgi:uncharacterized protein (DUF2384 family)
MTSLTLYKVTEELVPLLDGGIDPETGELSAELGEALTKFEGKGQAVAAYILNQDATADAIDEAIKKLEIRAMAFRKRAESLRRYLRESMARTGITAITADDGTFAVRLYRDRDASVEIFDEKQIPKDYMNTPQTPEPKPDKKKIADAIKSNADVPGARIVKKDRLEIR